MTITPGRTDRAALSRRGFRWEMTHGERAFYVRDSRGVQYLALLTANAGQEIPAATLASGVNAAGIRPPAAHEVIDDAARRHYRARLAELAEAIETADDPRAEALTRERDWLLRELAVTAGLGMRTSVFVTDEERARVAVGKAIRRAIDRIGRVCPEVAEHLRHHVRTGRYCVYRPDP